MRQFFLWLLVCWIVGIASGQWFGIRGTLVSLVVIGLVMWRYRVGPQLLVACIAVLLAGYLYGQPVQENTQPCVLVVPYHARVVGPPRLQAQRSQYTLETDSRCRLLVTAARFPVWREGEEIVIQKGTLKAVSDIDNAGYAAYLKRQGFHMALSYPTVQRLGTPSTSQPLSQRVQQIIQTTFVEPDAAVAMALLLANTDTLPQRLQENFRATGLSHLLAISGMNISLLAGILIGLLHFLPLSPLSRTIAISVILWGYMVLIGWPVSAVRATFFWTVALLALRLHLLVSLPTVLLLTLLLMISIEPLLITDVSFQLSVAAVAGIFITLFMTRRALRTLPAALKWLAVTLLVTTGATLTTWPIIAYHFGTISLISVPANLVVAPVVGMQMVTAISAVALGMVLPAVALLPAYLFHLTVLWMDVMSAFLASFTGTYLRDIALPPAALVIYYAAVSAGCWWWLHRQGRSWREIWQ